MKTLYLVRHGETNSNLEKKFQGRINTPLNETGLAGAAGLVERFAPITVESIYCSTLQRTRQTATPLATARSLPIWEEAALQEISFGKWEGLPFDEIAEQWPREYDLLYTAPSKLDLGGEENFKQAQERGWEAVKKILAQQSEDSSAVAVSHGGLIRLILCALLHINIDEMWKFSLNNVSITSIFESPRVGLGIKYINNIKNL